jgi:hypothetical protein
MSLLNKIVLPQCMCVRTKAERAVKTGRLYKRSAAGLGAQARGPSGFRSEADWFVNGLAGGIQHPLRPFPASRHSVRETEPVLFSKDMI